MITTRFALAQKMEAAGLPEEMIESLCRATAGLRHRKRADRARSAAWEAARDFRDRLGDWAREEPLLGLEMLLLAAEIVGTGGPGGLGGIGRGTKRARWARELGKGRANAKDGEAWNAAIQCAAQYVGLPPEKEIEFWRKEYIEALKRGVAMILATPLPMIVELLGAVCTEELRNLFTWAVYCSSQAEDVPSGLPKQILQLLTSIDVAKLAEVVGHLQA